MKNRETFAGRARLTGWEGASAQDLMQMKQIPQQGKRKYGVQPRRGDESLARLIARAPAWVASAVLHVVLIGLLLQVATINMHREQKTCLVSITNRNAVSTLERGDDKPPSLAPGISTAIDPAAFKYDENLTEADKSFQQVAGSMSVPRVISMGSYAARGGRKQLAKQGGGTPGSESAVDLALEWLQRHQSPDGSWKARDYTAMCYSAAPCKKIDDTLTGIDAGLTGMATLAFLGAGYTDERPPFTKTVSRALQYILKTQNNDGSFSPATGSNLIYNHAICTLAVCEAYGMTQNRLYKSPAERGVEYILRVQHRDGGWGYTRNDNVFRSDVSVTGWQVMALKSAAMAKIEVPAAAWSSAIRFIDGASDGNGLSGYFAPAQVLTPGNPSTIAVGLLCRQFAPVLPNPEMMASITDYMAEKLPNENEEGFFYYAYYGGLGLYQYGGPKWEKWNNHVRDLLLRLQKREGCETGSWDPGTRRWASWAGRVYSTSMAALTLEVYYRYLPIHRGFVDESPEAAVLRDYAKALEGYRLFIKLSDAADTPPAKLEAIRGAAMTLLEHHRNTSHALKSSDEAFMKEERKRLAATAVRLATMHMRARNYAKCIDEVKDFARKYPESEDQEAARKLYSGAMALLADTMERTGEEAVSRRLRQEAAENYYKQIVRDPNQPLAIYLQVAQDLYEREDWLRAAEIHSQIIERFANEQAVQKGISALRLRLARCLTNAGRYEDALKVFDAIGGEVNTRTGLEALAECYVQMKRYNDALGLYVRLRRGSEEGGPEWWQAQYDVAKVLLLLGRTKDCEQLIALQKTIRPGMGGPEFAAKFEDLLRASRAN